MKRAVVIGGSIAGLAAARALADRFERVTVLERDRLPEAGEHRKGVPQSRHPHAMLDAGRRELERLFPGFEAHCFARGALDLDPGLDMAFLRPTGWGRRTRSERTLLFASRVLIEGVIRDLAREVSRMEVREQTAAVELLLESRPPARVRGVRVRHAEGREEEIEADLVVDASGRATQAPEQLEKKGFPPIETTVVDAGAGYSSRWYQGPSGPDRPAAWWWRCLWIEPRVDDPDRAEDEYFGVLFPVENDRWVVTTASWGGKELASDPQSFERMISRLRTPVLAEAIARATPISAVFARRGMQNFWRHYESWRGELGGFVAIGDAVCAFNPVYGQGMTSASKCASVLEGCLAGGDPASPTFARDFFRAQAAWLQTPWLMATSRDRTNAHLDAEGAGWLDRLASLGRNAAALALGQLALAAREDAIVNRALFDLVNLSRVPSELLADPVLWARVALARARQLASGAKPDDAVVSPYPPSEILEAAA
jgi:2-polyprenyl-6-methoxyphenol hydroxylase-like FAD-dependent oxidoreductase